MLLSFVRTISPNLRLTRARMAIWLIFFAMGMATMGWVPRIPEMKKYLHLNNGQFGLILLISSIGAAVGSQLSGRLVHKYGSNVITHAATNLMSGAIILLGFSHNAIFVVITLFFLGISYSSVDVCGNTQAIALEGLLKKRVMVSFHGAWSLGTLLASFIGSIAIKNSISPQTNFIALGVVAFIINLYANRNLLSKSEDGHKGSDESSTSKIPLFSKSVIPLWWLALGTVSSLIAEGSISDWSGILLHENFNFNTAVSSTAFTAFAFAMIISRFSGDYFLHKYGAATMIKFGGLIGGVGMAFGIILGWSIHTTHPVLALVVTNLGFFVAGLGIGPMFPSFVVTAGALKEIPPSVAVSRLAVVGMASYFLGPSIIGGLAQLVNLPTALLYPALLLFSLGFTYKKMS